MNFPALIPSSRSFELGQFPTKRHKMMTNETQSILTATSAFNAQLRLTYANRTPTEIAQFMAHYDDVQVQGTYKSFQFTNNWKETVWGGWSNPNGSKRLLAMSNRWRYAAPPRISQPKYGVATIEIVLKQVPGNELDIPPGACRPEDVITDPGVSAGSGGSGGSGSGGSGGSGGPGGRPLPRPPGPGDPISPYPDPNKVYPSPLPPPRPPVTEEPDVDNPLPPGTPGSGDPGQDEPLQPSPPWTPDPPKKDGLYEFYIGYNSYQRRINQRAGKRCNNPGARYDDQIFVDTEPRGFAVRASVGINDPFDLDPSIVQIQDNGPKPRTYVEKEQYTGANNYSHKIISWTLNGQEQDALYKVTGLASAAGFINCITLGTHYVWFIPTRIRYQYRDIGIVEGRWRKPCSWYGTPSAQWSCAPGAEQFKLDLGQYPEFLGWTDSQGNPIDPTTGDRI